MAAHAQQPEQPPLHVRIDRAVAASHVGPVASRADDAQFLRRIHLDLTGMIPTSEEVRAFLADTSPDKRTKEIDRLLGSQAYVRHMAAAFDLMLMERRGDKHVKAPEWKKYLESSLAQNKPYNQLAAEILGADGADANLRAPARFFLDRDAEPNLLTREVGRMFFGVDLECAQCHDHPLIDDYLQADYYGLYAFVSRSYVFKPDKKKPAVLAEKAEGEAKFKSVFTGFEGQTRPRLIGGEEIDEPTFKKGEEYQVKPDKKKKHIRPIPKYSRRAELAKRAADGTNRAFNRNIVNRLWAHMMGRGLVHPPDLHHSGNPPSHPALLELLADDFVAMKFDVQAFIRELALSETYQRSFQMPESVDQHIAAARAELPKVDAGLKQHQQALAAATETTEKLAAERDAAKKSVETFAAEATKATAAVAEATNAVAAASQAQAEAEKALTTRQQVDKSLAEAVQKIQAALKRVPDDKELVVAAGKFVAKSKQTASEVAALSKTAAERTAAAAAARQQQAAAEKSAATQAAQLASANKQLAELAGRLDAARTAKSDAARQVQSAKNRLAVVQKLVAYGDAQTALAAANAARQQATANLAAAQTALKQSNDELARLQAGLPAAEQASTEATAAYTKASGEASARMEIAQLVAESLAKAEAAAGKLPNDADLALAIEKLKGRSAQLMQETAELKKTADEAQAKQKAAADALAALTRSIAAATTTAGEKKKQADALGSLLNRASSKAKAAQSSVETNWAELTTQWSRRFAVAPLEPLSPEQMAWSVLRATRQYEAHRTAAAAEINKKSPLSEADQKDPAKVAAREAEIDAAAIAKLQGNVAGFVKLFGAGAGQPQHVFYATVDQALYLANGGQVLGWLNPGGGSLTARLLKLEDASALAEELYLSVLTRLPTEQEKADVAAYLESRKENRNEAVREMAWALLTSTEFRFSH